MSQRTNYINYLEDKITMLEAQIRVYIAEKNGVLAEKRVVPKLGRSPRRSTQTFATPKIKPKDN